LTLNTTLSSDTVATDEAQKTDAETPTVAETVSEQAGRQEDPLEKDVLFEILKNQRRRDALTYLRENDGRATLSDMAEYIAARENDTTVEQLTSSQRKRVYIGLYQCHLPKMDAAGVVDFDKNRGTIVLEPSAEQFAPFLGDLSQSTESSTAPLVAASLVGAASLAGAVGLPLVDLVPEAGWAMLSASALIGFAAYEYVDGTRSA
jgi:hypothetical protein